MPPHKRFRRNTLECEPDLFQPPVFEHSGASDKTKDIRSINKVQAKVYPCFGENTVITLHTASLPRSQACGPLDSSPPNSTMIPCFDHSHQIPMDPDEGPAPPPFRSGSPRQLTKSLPVVVSEMAIGDSLPAVVSGESDKLHSDKG